MRKKLFFVLMAFFVLLAAPDVPAAPQENKIAAVMYHDFTDNPFHYSSFRVPPAYLEADIVYFLQEGYTFLSASELNYFLTVLDSGNRYIALTFDDGYESFYTTVYPLLKKYGVKATFFVVASRIGRHNYLSAEQIKEMSDSGLVEIGNHTYILHEKKKDQIRQLYEDPATFPDAVADIAYADKILEQVTGKDITVMSYPNGVYTDVLDQTIRSSLNYSTTFSTTFGAVHPDQKGKPFKRVNRDYGKTSEEFYLQVNNLK